MRLIIGGRNQGKLRYAMEQYGVSLEEVATDFKGAEKRRILDEFQQCVHNALRAGEDPAKTIGEILEKNPELIVICDEVGCGVFPVDREERIWRETVGRLCCALAQRAESVERIFCALPMRLK
jgi:adenosyl cobinamide kinase/adenosyl cobinamide phosphate guanylyltransferase